MRTSTRILISLGLLAVAAFGQRAILFSSRRPTYPLDLPGVTFSGAWGLHPLKQSVTNLFNLRRVSDSATQDVVKVGTGPDYASINTFLASTTGRVVTIYDQVGSANATQATAAQQPDYTTWLGRAATFPHAASGTSYFTLASGPSMVGRNFSVYAVFSSAERTVSGSSAIPIGTPYWGPTGFGAYITKATRATANALNLAWGTFPVSAAPMLPANTSINVQVWRSNATETRFRLNNIIINRTTDADTSTKTLDEFLRCPAVSTVSDATRLMAFLVGPAHTDAQEELVVAALRSLFNTSTKTTLVVFDGDSQTGGLDEGTSADERDLSWPYQLMQSINRPEVFASNLAIASSQLIDGSGDANKDLTLWAPNKIDSQLNSSYSKKILVVMAGRNDIGVIAAAGSGLTTYNRLVTYCQARRAAGWLKIIVVNGFPDKPNTTAGWASEMVDYVARIAANGLTDWDAVVDTFSLNWQPGGGSDWATSYQFITGLHPNGVGRTLIANAVKPVLAGFL